MNKLNNSVYLILGASDFQTQQIKNIISSIISNIGGSPDNLDIIPPTKHNWDKILEQVKTYSLFGTPKFFVIQDVNIFSHEKNLKEVIKQMEEYYSEGDYNRAYKFLLTAIYYLDLSTNEYDLLKENPSNIEKYFSDFLQNSDFLVEIIKKEGLPDALPEKAKDFDFDIFFKQIPKGHFVIITASEYDKRKKIFKLFQKYAAIFEQPDKLSPSEQKKHTEILIKKFINENKKNISTNDLLFLQELLYEHKNVETSLNKLALYTLNKNSITEDDIKKTFDDDAIPDTQTIMLSIRENNLEKIMKVITNARNTKQDFIKLSGYIRSMLRHGIIILELLDGKIINSYDAFIKELNIKSHSIYGPEKLSQPHPYYLFQCYLTLKEFNILQLKRHYLRLFDIDKDLKSSQKNPVDLFIDFFSEMLSPKN